MQSPEERLLVEFTAKQADYGLLEDKVHTLLSELLHEHVRYYLIDGRVKDPLSLLTKIQQKQYETLDDITDLLGLRIITYFPDDVEKVRNIIEREFTLDLDNCVDKRLNDNPAEFGYSSLHLIATLHPKRLNLPEYEQYTGMKFEIQIRTILQHAWAEIEHNYVYKPHSTVPPDVKRLFFRIAALLEVADLDFQRARDVIEEHSRIESASDAPLDGTTIVKLADEPAFVDLEKQLRPYWTRATREIRTEDYLRLYTSHLMEIGIATIGQLRRELVRNHGRILAFSQNRSQYIPNDFYPVGWSLMQLAQILYAEKESKDGVEKVVRSAYKPDPSDVEDRYNVLRRIIREVPENH